MKIHLTGPKGVGKRELAELVRKEMGLNLQLFPIKRFWKQLGIADASHFKGKCLANPQWAYNFQNSLLDYTEKEIGRRTNYVADFSVMDIMVFSLMYLQGVITPTQMNQLMKRTITLVEDDINRGVKYIFVPDRSRGDEESNMLRDIGNLYYHYSLDNLFPKLSISGLMPNSTHSFEEQVLTYTMIWRNS